MFAGNVELTVDVDNGNVSLVKLSYSQLDKAMSKKRMDTIKQVKEMGGDIFKAMRESNVTAADKTNKTKEQLMQERYDSYDKQTILEEGIKAWSFTVEKTSKTIMAIDEKSADKLFKHILDISLPDIEEVKIAEGKEA